MSQIEARGPQDLGSRRVIEFEGGEKLTIERVTSSEDPRVEKVQELLAQEFGREEVDIPEVTRAAIDGKATSGESTTRYIVCVAQNEQGEIVGVTNGAVLHLRDEEFEAVGNETQAFIAYTTSLEPYRRKGVASELFKTFQAEAEKEAQSRGVTIVAYTAEATNKPGSEQFLNSRDMREVYISQRNGRRYQEVQYYQPPVNWNKETGEPAEGAGTVPEHLMIMLANREKTISGDKVMEMVRGIYEYNNYWFETPFASEDAYETHNEFIGKIESRFERSISGKQLSLISSNERETMKEQNISFVRHEIAA